MSQRNPMNERYQQEDRKGATRKSAATAKPKSKAASSVHIQSAEKTKAQKKAEAKAKRQKQAELDRMYYNPPTEEYKRLRRIWWVLLGGAIILTILSFFGRTFMPEWGAYVCLGLAYACIIGSLYVDFSKIRKVRRKYQDEMTAHKSKELRALEKQAKAEARASQKAEAEAPAAEEPKKGLLGGLFSKKKAPAESTEAAKPSK